MDNDLPQKAVHFATNCQWKEAIDANKEILKTTPLDVDALNRLAKAYQQTGDVKKAESTSKKVVKIDPFNKIALKALDKYKKTGKGPRVQDTDFKNSKEAFLEEPGKTKIVELLNLGDSKEIASLNPGDCLKIIAHPHKVTINSQNGKYIGKISDDLASRLRTLIKGGNVYCVYVKSADTNSIKVFIREVSKGKGMETTPSFPPEKLEYISYTPPELVNPQKPTSSEEISEEY